VFEEFMDAGGYDNYQYWVDMEFVKDGVSLSWEESKELMVDSTNIIGPALWEVGTYLDGQEDYPVTGISWYEALAYARYKGNILPPMFHWAKAAYPPEEIVAPVSPKLLTNSNFSGKELIKVGQQGLGPYGTYDMTGNAREWVWNIFGGGGGADTISLPKGFISLGFNNLTVLTPFIGDLSNLGIGLV
jgi:formylglycine-generating enzyme required for sulfatase activity